MKRQKWVLKGHPSKLSLWHSLENQVLHVCWPDVALALELAEGSPLFVALPGASGGGPDSAAEAQISEGGDGNVRGTGGPGE